ncbi:hypothetical protein IMG5_000900 [Ichthyophthirius multifiliis]|uniref:Uncharacterized protein n=1 Tax=Ichthyophthirius multifiliis TaxID=5932 RepID=G0QIX7_ICHMU|nr:hypothetical protein IMG5_000900 [Ichthyophthirius multifiliis]EGR34862.1 hypothetical protein IMG5_000900 [Ichthyophthirius multifiliis]|eukprot:XP_004040166.1 hypothetical protein IMG5_000900 [Ichthyophthirius multifiliis]
MIYVFKFFFIIMSQSYFLPVFRIKLKYFSCLTQFACMLNCFGLLFFYNYYKYLYYIYFLTFLFISVHIILMLNKFVEYQKSQSILSLSSLFFYTICIFCFCEQFSFSIIGDVSLLFIQQGYVDNKLFPWLICGITNGIFFFICEKFIVYFLQILLLSFKKFILLKFILINLINYCLFFYFIILIIAHFLQFKLFLLLKIFLSCLLPLFKHLYYHLNYHFLFIYFYFNYQFKHYFIRNKYYFIPIKYYFIRFKHYFNLFKHYFIRFKNYFIFLCFMHFNLVKDYYYLINYFINQQFNYQITILFSSIKFQYSIINQLKHYQFIKFLFINLNYLSFINLYRFK